MSDIQPTTAWHTRYRKLVDDPRPHSATDRRRLYLIAITLVSIGTVFFAVVLVDVLQPDRSSIYDSPVRLWLVDGRSPLPTTIMIALAIVFGPVASK